MPLSRIWSVSRHYNRGRGMFIVQRRVALWDERLLRELDDIERAARAIHGNVLNVVEHQGSLVIVIKHDGPTKRSRLELPILALIPADWATLRRARRLAYADCRMKDFLLTLLDLAVTTAKVCGPGGLRAGIAENLVLKQQLIVLRQPGATRRSFRPGSSSSRADQLQKRCCEEPIYRVAS